MRVLKFDKLPPTSFKEGVHSYTTTEVDLDGMYARPNNKRRIGLKVFKEDYVPLDKFLWKNNNFLDCTKIQNLFWLHGFAPRVFDIITVEVPMGKRYAQVTEIVEDDERGDLDKEIGLKMRKIMIDYGISRGTVDPNPNHRYKELLVDFSHHSFISDNYKRQLIGRLEKEAPWGSNPKTYQSVEEFGVDGQRNLKQRLKAYRFDEINFKDKTVLDYGCSSGQVSRECLRRGAKRVVGLEFPQVANIAYELSNYLGSFNVDYYGGNFRHEPGNTVYEQIKTFTGLDKFDIVLYLSVQQLLMPDYLQDIVGEVYFLEGHSGDHGWTYNDKLKKIFKKVEQLEGSNDHSSRPVFRCSP